MQRGKDHVTGEGGIDGEAVACALERREERRQLSGVGAAELGEL